jgi:hypothetical protein
VAIVRPIVFKNVQSETSICLYFTALNKFKKPGSGKMESKLEPGLNKYPNLETSLHEALLDGRIHNNYKTFILDSQLDLINFESNSIQFVGDVSCCLVIAAVSPLDAPFGIYRSQVRRLLSEHGFKEATDIRHSISDDIDIPFFIRESLILVCNNFDDFNSIISIDDICIADRVIDLLNMQEKANEESMNYVLNSSKTGFMGKSLIKVTFRLLYRIYSKNVSLLRPIWVLLPNWFKARMRKLISKSFNQ